MLAPRRSRKKKLFMLACLGVLALAGGGAISQRATLQAWYYGYRLERAATEERNAWVDKLVGLGEPAGPRLLSCFRKDDTELCSSAHAGLERLLREWGPKDERSAALAERFFEVQSTFSPAGQMAALELLADLLPAGGTEAAAKARPLVTAALKDRSPELRILGIATALRTDLNLLPNIAPLLDDPEVRVRRAAILALGPVRDGQPGAEQALVDADKLLRWLHDPDPEVRRICEMSLRARGLRERDVRLGRMLTNPDPMDRLKLLIDLPDEEDLNLQAWLKLLSNDPDSAVRAGAARVAAERRVDLIDRLEQMAEQDPDGTVRKIAAHYRKLYR